jgi:uncharacterized OB-fold protein
MSERDPRFDPIKEQDGQAIIPDRWKIDFFVSAGELSRFFTELKDNARLMGTRCPECGSVYCWPRSWCHDCYVDCEWVEMSGKGKVVMFSRVEISLNDLQTAVPPFIQGSVMLEGARYPIVVFYRDVAFDDLHAGMPVRIEFKPADERTGRIRDFYFVPD